jgi:hypothetical protein
VSRHTVRWAGCQHYVPLFKIKTCKSSQKKENTSMTSHILISLIALLGLLWLLIRLATLSQSKTQIRWFPLVFMAFFILPISARFLVPLSHFVYETASDNVTWFAFVFVPLWILAGYFLWRYKSRYGNSKSLIAYGVMWIVLGFWCYLSMTISRYEIGLEEPALTDSVFYIADWVSVNLALVSLFFLLFFSPDFYKSKVRIVVSSLLFLIYLFLVVSI